MRRFVQHQNAERYRNLISIAEGDPSRDEVGYWYYGGCSQENKRSKRSRSTNRCLPTCKWARPLLRVGARPGTALPAPPKKRCGAVLRASQFTDRRQRPGPSTSLFHLRHIHVA